MLLGLLVCQQDYTKTTEQISPKLWMKDGSRPRTDLLTFGADPDKGKDQGFILSFFDTVRTLYISQGIMDES